jgi:fructose-specific phosphotransferase system IIC component
MQIPASVPGAAARQKFAQRIAKYVSPHFDAMTFLQEYLTQKQLKLNIARGAVVGAMAGGIVGGPLGAARRAYTAGAERQ